MGLLVAQIQLMRADAAALWSVCAATGVQIVSGCFLGLHTCIDKVRDAYNHGQGHGITPIQAKQWLRWAELRWSYTQINVHSWTDRAAPCGQYVYPQVCRLSLAVSMGSLHV